MKKIMIVDDEKVMRILIRKVLLDKYELVMASSGQEAIELYGKEYPDLVLLDVKMPNMSGYEALQIMQEKYKQNPPVVIFLTASKDTEDEITSFNRGAQDFIRKPVRGDILLKRLELILNSADSRKAARIDRMTGFLNRNAATNEIISYLSTGGSGTLIMIDIDSFKLVNDLYSHQMGDNVLIAFANILRSEMRSDSIMGRLGGDEFIVFVRNIFSAELLQQRTIRINSQVVRMAKDLMGMDCSIPLGASIGAAYSPVHGRTFDELYEKADKALYTVKLNGKHDFAVFNDESDESNQNGMHTSGKIEAFKTIFAERNITPGAYLLSKENFQYVYRALKRVSQNYKRNLQLLYITIEGDLSPEEADEAETFLARSLRTSDIMTRLGLNLFLLLLPETDPANVGKLEERLSAKWDSQFKTGKLEYETTEI